MELAHETLADAYDTNKLKRTIETKGRLEKYNSDLRRKTIRKRYGIENIENEEIKKWIAERKVENTRIIIICNRDEKYKKGRIVEIKVQIYTKN